MTVTGRIVRAAALAALPVFAACSGQGDSVPDPITVADSAGVRIVTNDLAGLDHSCSMAADPRVTIGNRQGDEAHELYRVFGATVLSDGRIALVNQGTQQLRLYSPDGDLIAAAGGEGQGPGEFQDAFLLWRLPGDTLWVGDYRPWEFEIFAPNGDWVRMVRPEPWYPDVPSGIGILADGRMVLASESIADRTRDFGVQHLRLFLHDPGGATIDSIASLPNGRWGQLGDDPGSMWLYPWFESFAEFTARDNRLVVAHGSSAELRIYEMSQAMKLDAIVRWTGRDRSVTGADVAAARREVEERYADLDAGMRRRFVDPLIDADRPVADVMPALTEVVIGTDESIWVKQFSRPGGPPLRQWIRFAGDGRFSCRLDVPEGIEVYEFGPDYVLGKGKGESDVEIVVLYDLAIGQ